MFSWPLAFLMGAIISPPDAVAATGIIKGLGLNTKVISILEGEGESLELKKKFEQVAGKLANEINIHTRNENQEEQLAVRTLTEMQKAQIEIGRFQRELLLKLHKDGRFSDTVIRQVERDMDIDELKLNQLLPKGGQ